MDSNFIVAQIFSVHDGGHAEVISISPGYETIWAIPARAFAGKPGSGRMRFIPEVGSEMLRDLYAESLANEQVARRKV